MIEIHSKLKTEDGLLGTFIVHPDENDPYPVILFLMDTLGKREELHDMTQRIASLGYYMMLPNLYYRRTPLFNINGSSPDQLDFMFEYEQPQLPNNVE